VKDLVSSLRRRVAAEVARRGLFSPGSRVLVACSGGPDSLALFDLLLALPASSRPELHVAAVDHGLRPEAAGEAQAAVDYARSRGVTGRVLPVRVPRPSMAAARTARYGVLVEEARRLGAAALAVGHTATDQAETLLDRLTRGAGLVGLAAMPALRPLLPGLALVRPLLDVTAAETRAYVAALGLPAVEDPTNRDPAYKRSRLRL
jgi:tRNA(Ile)-lysidine synthase